MKTTRLFTLLFALLLLGSCAKEKAGNAPYTSGVKEQIQQLSRALTEAEKNDDLKTFLTYYDESAISMPEYQPTLHGIPEIQSFYREIFGRQRIKTFHRQAEEIIELDSTIVEIGTFQKEYTDSQADTLVTRHGKYWNVWYRQKEGNYRLKGEAFGFFHPVAHPEALTVRFEKVPAVASPVSLKEMPFELKAYNALMEKGVTNRDGVLRAEFFTEDAVFFPFQEPAVRGMDQLKPYLINYNSGKVTIDSISVYTYDYERFDEYILEYAEFRVRFTVPDFSGKTEGKGIRIWKRQADQTLKIYREIGTHNHL